MPVSGNKLKINQINEIKFYSFLKKMCIQGGDIKKPIRSLNVSHDEGIFI